MSSNVLPFPKSAPPAPPPPISPHEAFGQARQAMLKAYRAWLASKPDLIDVNSEIEGTHNVLTGLRDMWQAYDV